MPGDRHIPNRLVNVRLSQDEYEAMMRAMDEAGEHSISAFCRKAIFSSPAQPLSEIALRLTRLEFLSEALSGLVRNRL